MIRSGAFEDSDFLFVFSSVFRDSRQQATVSALELSLQTHSRFFGLYIEHEALKPPKISAEPSILLFSMP